jgi:hypothetical protein
VALSLFSYAAQLGSDFNSPIYGRTLGGTIAITANPGMRWRLSSSLLFSTDPRDGDVVTVTETVNGVSTDYPFRISVLGGAKVVTPYPVLTVGVAYDGQPIIQGGTGNYYFMVANGVLPLGLVLSSVSGRISGVPINYTPFTINVTDQGVVDGGRSLAVSSVIAPAIIVGTPLYSVVTTTGTRIVDTAGNSPIALSVFDDGSLTNRSLWATKGLLTATSIQADNLMNAAGPTGFATVKDWIASQVDAFVPGFVMMADVFNPDPGTNATAAGSTFDPALATYNMAPLIAFLDDARARGKKVRGHVIGLYAKRDIGTWVQPYLANNPGQWQVLLAARINKLCDILANYRDILIEADVLNELINSGSTNINQWQTTPWSTAAAVVAGRTAATATLADYMAAPLFAVNLVRQRLPGLPLAYCQNQTEQLGTDFYKTFANNVLAAIKQMQAAGAVFQIYAQQGHLEQRQAFSAPALRTFLTSIWKDCGLRIHITELDVHSGFASGKGDVADPGTFALVELERINAGTRSLYLDVAMPLVLQSGGNIVAEWTEYDGYNSWRPPAGELPCMYNDSFVATQQYSVTRKAIKGS